MWYSVEVNCTVCSGSVAATQLRSAVAMVALSIGGPFVALTVAGVPNCHSLQPTQEPSVVFSVDAASGAWLAGLPPWIIASSNTSDGCVIGRLWPSSAPPRTAAGPPPYLHVLILLGIAVGVCVCCCTFWCYFRCRRAILDAPVPASMPLPPPPPPAALRRPELEWSLRRHRSFAGPQIDQRELDELGDGAVDPNAL